MMLITIYIRFWNMRWISIVYVLLILSSSSQFLSKSCLLLLKSPIKCFLTINYSQGLSCGTLVLFIFNIYE
uniref:Uncharacterized protein n=1 Tax=Rhizophora mucronata TaxID=61149 RepID=A0A2P2MXS9_RHIMU